MTTAVRLSEYASASSHRMPRPHARTAARTPSARRRWRAKTRSRPSAWSMSSASRSPNSTSVAGVYGKKPAALSSRIGRQSKKFRGLPPFAATSIARGDAHTSARPGGSMRPFWLPVSATSTPHSSNRKSMLPSELTVSTMSSASLRFASIASRTARTSLRTPVEVSLCTTRTARCSGRRCSATADAGTLRPQRSGTRSTAKPRLRAAAAKPALKWPWSNASTRSPGASTFTRDASHAPVPDEGYTITRPRSVLKTRARSGRRPRTSAAKAGPR